MRGHLSTRKGGLRTRIGSRVYARTCSLLQPRRLFPETGPRLTSDVVTRSSATHFDLWGLVLQEEVSLNPRLGFSDQEGYSPGLAQFCNWIFTFNLPVRRTRLN